MMWIVPGDQVVIRGRRLLVASAEWLTSWIVEILAADGTRTQAHADMVHPVPGALDRAA